MMHNSNLLQVSRQVTLLTCTCMSVSQIPSSSFEKAKLTNHSTYESELLHVNWFSSELVHRHIICSLTLLLLVKQLIMCPDNTL